MCKHRKTLKQSLLFQIKKNYISVFNSYHLIKKKEADFSSILITYRTNSLVVDVWSYGMV